MSILVCPICEENRTILTQLVADIQNELGKSIKGFNPFFATLACSKCGGQRSLSFKHHRQIQYTALLEKDGSFTLKAFLHPNPIFNSVFLIAKAKTTLETIHSQSHFENLQYSSIFDLKIFCSNCNE